mgnify:CR=1 FL=1
MPDLETLLHATRMLKFDSRKQNNTALHQPVSCAPYGRSSGPRVVGPAQADLGMLSESPASQSRRRGRDLETVLSIESYA